jgi:outer membrane lipoprotein SlyB
MSDTFATPLTAVSAPASASPWLWFVAGVLGTAGLGAGAAAYYVNQQSASAAAPLIAPAPATSVAPAAVETVLAPVVKAPATAHVAVKKSHPALVHTTQGTTKNIAKERDVDVADATLAQGHPAATPAQPAVEQAPVRQVCSHCGTVESITPVPVEAKPSGLGAAAGAVLGGLLGNQFGGGEGKTLATIGGVLGGAYAGNTVEKRMNQQTSYRVLVRMDDGSVRNVEQSSLSVGVGARVSVQGNVLAPVGSAQGQGA